MISALNAQAQSFLAGLSQIQQRLQTSQTELTTGLQINNVSDAPSEIADIWQLNSELDQTQQTETNLGQVQTEVDTAQSALQAAVTLVEQAETYGTQGASDTSSATTRQDLANSLGGILQQLVATANTTVQGRYIFAGDTDQTTPYTIDLTQTSPISGYQGSASTRLIQGADGTAFPVALTAQQIFDSSNSQDNVFISITSLMQGLQNNNDTEINSAIGDVQSADTYLNQQLAFYGTVQGRVTGAQTFGQNYTVELQTQLSGVQDANEAADITNMTQAQTQLQAALQSEAQLPKTTLFDFLS
ncbi:MAG TPA: flagellin [Bryobacteraceae bacterium]|jgi:flagellar hook-associated protein 3 FlgL|nr:flagellin [Bryobacteraceae bacterium]